MATPATPQMMRQIASPQFGCKEGTRFSNSAAKVNLARGEGEKGKFSGEWGK
jgi:hypothetical protein